MTKLDIDTSYDFQIFSAIIDEIVTNILVRTADSYISVFPKSDESLETLVLGFQRIIDNIDFYPDDIEYVDAKMLISFDYYKIDYIKLPDPIIINI